MAIFSTKTTPTPTGGTQRKDKYFGTHEIPGYPNLVMLAEAPDMEDSVGLSVRPNQKRQSMYFTSNSTITLSSPVTITAGFNQGSFAHDDTVYVYVVDGAGSVSPGVAITLDGSIPGTHGTVYSGASGVLPYRLPK